MNKTNYTYLFVLCSCFFFLTNAKAQPAIEWEKSYGGSNNETAQSIIQTSDGGYIVAGGTSSNDGDVLVNKGGSDCWVVKLDAIGIIQWEKTYGGTGNESISTILKTADSGYIFVASTLSNDGDVSNSKGNTDYWVVKIDSVGNIEWEKSYGGSGVDAASEIQMTIDGGYIVVGFSESSDGDVTGNNGSTDYWIVKIDSVGNLQWQKNYGGSSGEGANSVIQTINGDYMVVGGSTSNDGNVTGNNGSTDYWVLKLDGSGNLLWQKSYGGSNSDRGTSIVSSLSGSYYVIAGDSRSIDGDVTGHIGAVAIPNYWIIKIDSAGNLLWEKNFGGTFSDIPEKIITTTDSGYVIIGSSGSSDFDVSSNYGNWDYWVLKIDSVGIIEWEKNYGGSFGDFGYTVVQTTDNSIMLAGYSGSNDFDVSFNNGIVDFWVVKLSPTVGVDEVENNSSITIFPNPTKGVFTINFSQKIDEVEVFNTLGQAVYNKKTTFNSTTIDLTPFPKGIYLVQIKTNNKVVTKKMIHE